MPTALDGFLAEECDAQLAGRLRAEVEAAQGQGYDHFELNLFDVELYYAENRVTIAEAVPLGYTPVAASDRLALGRHCGALAQPTYLRPDGLHLRGSEHDAGGVGLVAHGR
jgi:hypothetical protein